MATHKQTHIAPHNLHKGIPEKLINSNERILLTPHQKENTFPDLLALQKK